MNKTYVEEVLERANKMDDIPKILGIEKKDYTKLVEKLKPELVEILKTGSFTEASVKLLRWLGIEDEKIDVEKLVKGILVIKNIVFLNNKLARIMEKLKETIER